MKRVLAPVSVLDRFVSRRRFALQVFAGSFALVCLVAVLLPKRYEAHMQFLLQNERVNSLISPDQKAQGILYLDEVGESRINTEVALLSSDLLLRRVIAETGLAPKSGNASLDERAEENVMRQLRRNIAIAPLRKSDIIQVTYNSGNPRQAAQVLQSLASSYLDLHLRLRGAKGLFAFYKNLAGTYADQQHEAEGVLARFKRVHHIVALPEEKSVTLQRVADLEKQYADSSAARDRSANSSAQLQALSVATPATILSENKTLPNQYEVQQLSTLLVTLRNKQLEASARYRPDELVMQDLDQEIKHTQQALDAAMSRRSEEITRSANPVLTSIQTESARVSAENAGYQTQASTLSRQLDQSRRHLQDLDEDTASYEELLQKVKSLTEQRESYDAKLNEARMSEMLDQDHIANVTLVDAPHEQLLPASPKRGLIVELGFIWSVLLGVAAALVLDVLRRRVTGTDELERALHVRVLVEIGQDCLRPQHTAHLAELCAAMQRRDQQHKWRLA